MTRNNFQIDSAAISDRGLSKKRPQNEDSFLQLAERGVFAVADGVGGAQAGDVASQMAVEILGEAFTNSLAGSDAEEVMKMAISHANSSIFQMSNDLPQLSTMATTVVALHIDGNIATIGHVGDSRLYRLDGRSGNLFRETQDHSVVEEEVRAGRMTPAQAVNHPSRNVISRALGAEPTVEIDMKTIMFEPNTSFLICSDGITRHIDDLEIRELLQANENLSTICERMKEICYERGAEDNLTAVIVKITEASAASSDVSKVQPNLVNLAPDLEEATIAAPRQQPIVGNASIAHSISTDDEIPTQNLDASILKKTEINKTNFSNEPTAEHLETQQIIAPTVETQPRIAEVKNPEPVPEIKREVVSVETAKQSGGGFFGRLLSALLLLSIGAVLGAGAYYFWLSQNKIETPPALPPMQSQNIPFTSFEQNRRNVDNNPQQFVETNKLTPADAEGFYLLGRAHLLTDNLTEAKKNFLEAKNRLGQTSDANRKVLENEIAMGLAIINAPTAQPEFKRELNPGNANVNLQTNTNVNLSVNNANSQ